MEGLTLEKELISIVVPVYNCESYLEECIDSIIAQTYKDLEIILVDDGSTDLSGRICDGYSQKDDRIKVIHKDNGGQQDARSAGIAIAQGIFIGFVDSDDWIDKDMYEALHKNISSSDLVTSGIWQHENDGSVKKVTDALGSDVYNAKSRYFCDNLIIYDGKIEDEILGGIGNSLSNKLFRTSIVKKMYEKVNVGIRSGEDLLFTILYALMCDRITVTHECYYHYRYDPASASNSKDQNYLTELNILYNVLDKAIVGHAFEESLRDQSDRLLLYLICSNTPFMMKLGKDLCYPRYVFPRNDLLRGKKIVLYGCGKIGKSYYLHWKYDSSVRVVQWIDSLPSEDEILGCRIDKAAKIIQDGYDHIVCATMSRQVAEEMKAQLVRYGIRENMILWERPIDMFKDLLMTRSKGGKEIT